MKVLIAEDDAVMRTVLRELILQLGDEPVLAVDGDDAWARHQQVPCDVVISDWRMPGCDGLELLARIRGLDAGKAYTYFILLTASDAPAAVEKALAAGADDHLSKPVRRAELLARLSVARRIVALNHDAAERNRQLADANRRMRRDLAAAANAQKHLLPTELPELPGISLGWRYQPCEECAGDLLGVQRLGEHHLGMWLFDVSGHGVAAALQAVQVARLLPALMRGDGGGHGDPPAPLAVAQALNQAFYAPGSLRFVTLVYALLDLRSHRLQFVSSAHPSPLLLRASGGIETYDVVAHPLGLFPASEAKFCAWETTLEPGDRVLFISDGVLEAPGGDTLEPNPLFGGERLEQEWRRTRDEPLEEALTGVMDALAIWRGAGQLTDDITLLGLARGR
jgi:sigma-B regulation protein RsbU (phosphoserine phosphatase)